MYRLIAENRKHLDRWLRWSSALDSVKEVAAFIGQFEAKEQAGDGFHLGLWDGEQLAGGVVCWGIHRGNRNAEVGYWLGANFTRRGLATRGAKSIIAHLFEHESLHRVEMQCGVDNRASRAVAERCGLTAEGIRRGSHWITDRFVDHVVYGVLESEWEASR
ncbi:MAG: GNAT family protein [Rhodothermales bacterium]